MTVAEFYEIYTALKNLSDILTGRKQEALKAYVDSALLEAKVQLRAAIQNE